MDYLAIDLEMTGLNVKNDHILEIGAIRMAQGQAHGSFCALVNPHCRIPAEITELTGITPDMADHGEELSDVLPRFLEFMGELPLLGHNLSFDYSFLKQACVNRGLPLYASGIDTLRIARHFLPAEQKKNLAALREYFSIHTDQIHRANADAWAAAQVYERLLRDYGDKEPEFFLPKPIQISLKKQQPLTIPQREQLERLLSVHPSAMLAPADISHLTRSEASRLIESLLHGQDLH
jgi:DNA polymerase-3 subunit alpha (Gram-positive type)